MWLQCREPLTALSVCVAALLTCKGACIACKVNPAFLLIPLIYFFLSVNLMLMQSAGLTALEKEVLCLDPTNFGAGNVQASTGLILATFTHKNRDIEGNGRTHRDCKIRSNTYQTS